MAVLVKEKIDTVAEYLTLVAAAAEMETSKNALYCWMKRNNIPCMRLGRSLLVRKSDIVAYIPRGK